MRATIRSFVLAAIGVVSVVSFEMTMNAVSPTRLNDSMFTRDSELVFSPQLTAGEGLPRARPQLAFSEGLPRERPQLV